MAFQSRETRRAYEDRPEVKEHIRKSARERARAPAARKKYNLWCKTNREWRNFVQRLACYGLTLDQYHAMQERQDFCCAVCEEELPLIIEHDHETKYVRGLTCYPCNIGLGQFKDSSDLLLRAVNYLNVRRKR